MMMCASPCTVDVPTLISSCDGLITSSPGAY